MSLEFRYGNYRHPAGEAVIQNIAVNRTFSDRGVAQVEKRTYSIHGCVEGDDPAQVTAVLLALEKAYERQGVDAGLWDSATGTWTAHFLDSSKALGGVRSMGVSYDKGDGAEYTTYRNYTITLEAEFALSDQASGGLLEFNETLTFIGTGGPKFIFLYPVNGSPVKQMVQQQTTQMITQSGTATGKSNYPPFPGPLFPTDEHVEQRQLSNSSPKVVGGIKQDWGSQWTYVFESASPLQGKPHTS